MLQPPSAGTNARRLHSPTPAQQSTGWEISVAMGFSYKRPKDVDVNQVPRYTGREFSALKLNLIWKLFSKKHFLYFKCPHLALKIFVFQAGFRKISFMHSNIWLLFPNILLGLMRDITFADSRSALRRDTALETSTLPTEHTQIMYHGIFLLLCLNPLGQEHERISAFLIYHR